MIKFVKKCVTLYSCSQRSRLFAPRSAAIYTSEKPKLDESSDGNLNGTPPPIFHPIVTTNGLENWKINFNENYSSARSELRRILLERSNKYHTAVTFGRLGKFNPSEFVPKNILEPYHNAWRQTEFGRPADKKPFPIELKKDKNYMWCACGWSKQQPFCDGTHTNVFMKITMRPVKFQVEKDGKYWLCRCKQTKHRPFCDGSHNCEEVQDKTRFL